MLTYAPAKEIQKAIEGFRETQEISNLDDLVANLRLDAAEFARLSALEGATFTGIALGELSNACRLAQDLAGQILLYRTITRIGRARFPR